jgi:hypothetical protein
VRYAVIALLNAAISGLGVCVFVVGAVGAVVSAAIDVPVLVMSPAATKSPTFLAEMNFMIFSFVSSCL